VERAGEDPALADQHRPAVDAREHLHLGPRTPQLRRADEHAAQLRQRLALGEGGEGIDLRAVGVAHRHHVEQAEARHRVVLHLARQQDRPGAGAEDRPARLGEGPDRLVEALARQALRERRARRPGSG
jgi:hypothetical protein